MKMRIRWLIATVLGSVLLTSTSARAVVVTNGCANTTSCLMEELLAGGSITIDDKLFHSFQGYDSTVTGPGPIHQGMPISADNIRVFSQLDELGALGVPGEIGLAFNIGIGNPTQLALLDTGQSMSIGWQYEITVLDPNRAIIDNTLLFPSGIHNGASIANLASINDGASLTIVEQLFNSPTGEVVARKQISATDSGGTPISDHRDFAPFTDLLVITEISGFGGNNPQPQTSVSLDWFVQSFSQVQVPEPGTLALLALGVVGLGFARRKAV